MERHCTLITQNQGKNNEKSNLFLDIMEIPDFFINNERKIIQNPFRVSGYVCVHFPHLFLFKDCIYVHLCTYFIINFVCKQTMFCERIDLFLFYYIIIKGNVIFDQTWMFVLCLQIAITMLLKMMIFYQMISSFTKLVYHY